VLQPLKKAYESLEGRSKSSKFRALYKIILQFKAILKVYKSIIETYKAVDFNATGALKDYLLINLRAV